MKSRISKFRSRFKFNRPENLRIIALSIATAAVFWLFNALNKEYDATVGYPVNWDFDPEAYIIVDKLPSSVRINVNGLGWNLLRVSLGLKVNPINIDLVNPIASRKLPGIALTNRIDDDLEDLRLNYILEDTLELNIDNRATRTFAVYIDSANISLADNFRIVSPIQYDVDLLEIEGPNSILYKNPSDSFLIPIPETELNGNYSENLAFTIERRELFLFNPTSVNVSFDVAEFIAAERQVVINQLEFSDKAKFSLIDTICTVQFFVRKDLEQSIVADSFNIAANYNLLNLTDTTLMLRILQYPEAVTDVRIALPQIRLQHNE